jgi:hypothetical protein
MYFLNEQFGRILFVVAIAAAVAGIVLNPAQKLDPVADTLVKRDVTVELNKAALAALSKEAFYAVEPPAIANTPFEPEKHIVVFQSVDLDIPSPGVKRPAQLLPEPGPSLEGSEKLPRWGDEFPKPKTTAGTGAIGDVKTPPVTKPVGTPATK